MNSGSTAPLCFPPKGPVRVYTGESIWRKRAPWSEIDFEISRVTIGRAAESATWQPQHRLFVTLAGGTRATEAQAEGERRYVGADTPGAVSFIPAGRKRRGWYRGDAFEVANIALPPETIARVAGPQAQLERLEFVPATNRRDPYIHSLVLALRDEMENGGVAGRLFVETAVAALSLHLVRRYSSLTPRPASLPALPADKLRMLLDYIEDHLSQDVSLASLAQRVEMSADSLARRFKQAMGMPPHRHVMIRRLERAKDLLRESELSLAEIAYVVGFSSQSHFTTVFRQHTGVTPRIFKQSEQRRHLHPLASRLP
jgi:AraC family transcriptional regulator